MSSLIFSCPIQMYHFHLMMDFCRALMTWWIPWVSDHGQYFWLDGFLRSHLYQGQAAWWGLLFNRCRVLHCRRHGLAPEPQGPVVWFSHRTCHRLYSLVLLLMSLTSQSVRLFFPSDRLFASQPGSASGPFPAPALLIDHSFSYHSVYGLV